MSDLFACDWCGDITQLVVCNYFCSMDLCAKCSATHTEWHCVTREQAQAHLAEILNSGSEGRLACAKGPKVERVHAVQDLLRAMP